MPQGNNLKRDGLPTLQMISIFAELERQGAEKGSVMAIARSCGVNHSTVSRYLKMGRETGLLTEELEFTGKGKIWLRGYRNLEEEITLLLRRAGVPQQEIPDNVRKLIENLDYRTLRLIFRFLDRQQEAGDGRADGAGSFLGDILEYGRQDVCFSVFAEEGERKLSMADRGFCRPGAVVRNKRGSWLELQPCRMRVWSPVAGREIEGMVDGVRYRAGGELKKAKSRGGKLRIPLNACSMRRMDGGGITAWVRLLFTCSAGRIHMPEREARLVFWL